MTFTHYLRILPVLAFAACAQGKYSSFENADTTKTANATFDTTSLESASRKWVRTADVRCRVSSVFGAVTTLENTVNNMQGKILESTIQNEIGRSEDQPYSSDSLKRVQLYTPIANLSLRVPVAGLDSVVHTLTAMAVFIDHRTLKQEDKSLNYLSNEWQNQEPETTIKVDKTSGALQIAGYQDAKKNEKIDRKIENLAILDDVHYATLTVQLFQSERADVQTVVNPERVIRAGFGTEIADALHSGTNALRNVILFFLQLWPFLLLLSAGIFAYRRRLIFQKQAIRVKHPAQ